MGDSNWWVDVFGLSENYHLGDYQISSPTLPAYDKNKTEGVLYYIDKKGEIQAKEFSSGGKTDFPNYANSNHVEGKSALFMRDNAVREAVVFHNNTDGTCSFCVAMTETLLPKGTVVPPENAVAKKRGYIDVPKTFIGNENEPKRNEKNAQINQVMYLNDFKQEYLINSLNELNNILTKRFFEDSNHFILTFEDYGFPQLSCFVKKSMSVMYYLEMQKSFISKNNNIYSEENEVFYEDEGLEHKVFITKSSIIPINKFYESAQYFFKTCSKPMNIDWLEL